MVGVEVVAGVEAEGSEAMATTLGWESPRSCDAHALSRFEKWDGRANRTYRYGAPDVWPDFLIGAGSDALSNAPGKTAARYSG